MTMAYEKDIKVQGQEDAPCADERIESLIQETENALRNTRSFLDHLRSSERSARDLVDSIKQRFEKELETLQRRSDAEISS
jgi:signal transduction histidine kinase